MSVDPDFVSTTRSVVVARLRDEILAGVLPSGTRLRQADIAARFKISTTPVREAFRELATLGLVEINAHRGAVVLGPSGEELAHIYEVRVLLEPMSVAWSAQRVTPEQLEQAQQIIGLMQDPASPEAMATLNRRFHALLAEACGNQFLGERVLNLLDLSTPYIMRVAESSEERAAHQTAEHVEILAACAAGDPDRAYAASLRHLMRLPLEVDEGTTSPIRPNFPTRWLPPGVTAWPGPASRTSNRKPRRKGTT
jgi:DNA-binding GntR family transcriptional regulator